MRLIRVLTACMAASVLVVVVLGTGSASATALCKSSVNPCAEAEIHASGTELEAKQEKREVVLDTDTEDVECEEVKVKGEWETDKSGEYTHGVATELEFPGAAGKCETTKVPKAGCKITAQNLPYNMNVAAAGGGNGTVGLGNGGFGAPSIKFECGAALNCTFSANELPFEVTGGTPAKATLKGKASSWTGTTCPKLFAEPKGTFKVEKPASLFIVSEVAPPKLCSEKAGPCPALKVLGKGTLLEGEAEAESRFVFTYLGEKREPACKVATFTGEMTEAGKPLRGKITPSFETCGATCNVSVVGAPYEIEIDRTGGGNGWLTWSKLTGSEPTFEIKCGLGGTEKCVYHTPSIEFNLTGDAAVPKLRSVGKVSLTGSSVGCSTTATWQGVGGVEEVRYKFTKPTAMFVTS